MVLTSASQLSQLPTKFDGLRYVAFKSQVLLSSGINSLDSILGGGIPLGTTLLIEEDEFGVCSEVLMRYFYAEALASNHSILLASPNGRCRNMIYHLPLKIDLANKQQEKDNPVDFQMKIAWRYQGNAEASSMPSSSVPHKFGHQFDLMANFPLETVDAADITVWPKNIDDECSSYESALRQIAEVLGNRNCPVRVGIHCLGSLGWSSNLADLPVFLYALRCLIYNHHSSVAVVTISPHLIKNVSLLKRCEDICDSVISLESLVNNPYPLYSEYKALVNIPKYPSINSLSPYRPEANDWAMKLQRRKCVIEKLHLPVELESGDKKESSQNSPLCHRPAANIDF